MRKINIKTWKAQVPVVDDSGKVIGSKEGDEDLLTALNNLIGAKKPEDVPRGLDKFRLFGRLSKAFSKADKSKVLQLEEADYSFLKETIEKDVPSTWGMSENILNAVEEFMSAEQE